MSMLKSAAEKKLSQSVSETLQLEPEEQEKQTNVTVVEISSKKDAEKISFQSESLQGPAAQEKQISLSVVEIISKKEKSPSQEARKKKQEKTVEVSLTLDQIMQKKLDRYFGSSLNKSSRLICVIYPNKYAFLLD
jgi:predicted protein tyrosine phosphatase